MNKTHCAICAQKGLKIRSNTSTHSLTAVYTHTVPLGSTLPNLSSGSLSAPHTLSSPDPPFRSPPPSNVPTILMLLLPSSNVSRIPDLRQATNVHHAGIPLPC